MAGASSLQDDILALVKKHSDTCLPEDLLARVSEDARLLAAKMKIRSLHEEDPFGLFSDGRDEEGAENGGGGEGARKVPSTDELPDNVLRMLEGMKINRLDKVAALNGFTTIDAEVEFSRTGTDSTTTAAASAGTDGPTVTSAAATRGKPTLSEGTVAAAARAAAAAGGKATKGAEEDEGTSSDEDDDDDHDDDAESPVFLTFRFRREPLRSGPAESSRGEGGRAAGGGDARDRDHQKAGEVIDLALDDDDDDDDDEEEEPSAVISTTPKGDNEGGSMFEKKGSATAVPAKIAAGKDVSCDGGGGGGGGGGDSHGKEGRKRAGSRGRESEEGRGGNDKGRKRPKGGEEEGEEEDEGADDEEGRKQGVNGNAKQCEEDDEGLDYEPRTLVSYSISGGIGYDAPATLLQALVYARGDGPACVMPPPKPKGDDDVDDNDDEEEEEEDGGSVCNDQEDVFDCDVNGPALAALGRALGLHTEDPPTSDSDSDSSPDDGGDVRMKDSGALPLASAKGPEKEPDTADGEPGKGIGSMTQSDLVWWLLLFPFFEKEFDVVEVVASSVFGEDDSDDSDDGGGEESDPEA